MVLTRSSRTLSFENVRPLTVLIPRLFSHSATVQSLLRKTGSYAATFANAGSATGYADARRTMVGTPMSLTASGDFFVSTEGAAGANVPFLRLFTSSGTRLISLYRQNQASNRIYVSYGGSYLLTTGALPLNSWGQLSLRVVVNGTSSTVEVKLNGSTVYLTSSASLGSAGVASVQIGNETASQTFSVTADNVTIGN